MHRSSLAILILFFALSVFASGQSVACAGEAARLVSRTESSDDRALAQRALAALNRLEGDVILYRTLGDFEASGKLARVPLETFQNDLREVSTEVETILTRLPPGRLKTEISNALSSYRDGGFWWAKIYQPRVVNVSSLSFAEIVRTPSDAAYVGTVPYTVAIHWRQASKYARRAEEIIAASLNQKLQ